MSLLPNIPTELRAARIGSCFDTQTRTFMPNVTTFNLGMLDGQGLLLQVGGKAQLKVHSDSSSSAFSEGSFFDLDTKAQASGAPTLRQVFRCLPLPSREAVDTT